MTEYELTPIARNGYDGYMDPSTPEQSQEQSSSSEEVLPGPVSDAARSLYRNAQRGTETGDAPQESMTDAKRDMAEQTKKRGEKNFTRDELKKVAQTVEGKSDANEVLNDAEFVSIAAKILIHNIKADVDNLHVNKALLDEFERRNIITQAENIEKLIKGMGPDGESSQNESTEQRDARIRSQATAIAKLSSAIAGYYEKAKISKEYDDPFRQVVSFEELMTKFNITMDDDRFRPGGEFALMNITEYVDEFGRELSTEEAHPENFLRWVTERAWFYHDFDPMKDINLFEGMYLVAGSRKLSMYEMLVDFNAYFTHRVMTKGELKVLEEDVDRASKFEEGKAGRFIYAPEEVQKNKEKGYLGYYKDIEVVDRDTGEKIKVDAYVSNVSEADDTGRKGVLRVYYKKMVDGKEVEVPVEAVLANKESWGTEKIPEYDKAQEEIMYQLWLMTRNHNADIAYRQKGMPTEKALNEAMAEIYSDNIWTRTRRRLLGVLDMPATTFRGEKDKNGNPVNEAAMKWKGQEGQGTLGKAVQRSLAAYYHIAEANAAFQGYSTDGNDGESFNPFFEVLRKGDINGAEIFYRRLIQRTLFEDKEKFGYVSSGYDQKKEESWIHSKIEVEFFNILNTIRVPEADGTTRKRFEWEKADFVSFMSLSQTDFLSEMAQRQITQETFDKAFITLKETYAKNPTRLAELDKLQSRLAQDSTTRREAFVNSLVGKAGIKEDAKTNKDDAKKGFMYRFLHPDGKDPTGGLDLFAVGLFTKAFATEFTPDINPFVNIRYGLEARERMRGAMRDALMYTEKLDDFDAKWAEEWAYTFTFHTGISARNDMQGIGHDAWSKILNTEFYRLRQSGGGNYPGNLDNLYGIHRLGADFWQGLKVQEDGSGKYEKTLYEILVGLEKHDGKYVFNVNKDIKSFEFAGNAMRQFYADHVNHAIELFIDITQKQEFNLDKIVQHDNWGRLTWNNEEMQKMIDSTWKHLRYGFDNNGFLYDNMHYGWLYDETMNDEGAISRTPHFAFKTLRNLMFSEKVQEMNMYARKDVSGWDGRKDEVYHGKMARNVFAYLISAQLREHTRYSGGYRIYSADEVAMITQAFMNYAARVMQGEDGETIVMSGFFSPEEIMRILVAANAILWMLYAKEYSFSLGGGFLFGFFEAFALIMKQFGAGIKL